MDELETRMRQTLLALEMTSNARTAAYDSSGGGSPDYVLVDDHGRGKLDPDDAPHLRYAKEWDRAEDEVARAAVLKAAQDTLDRIRRSHADPAAVETKDQRDRRIIKQGRGWPAGEVAIAIRCGITDVHKARAAAGLDLEFGEERVNGRAMTRAQRDAEIVSLRQRGMNPFQIAAKLGIPRTTVRDVLARPG